MFIKVSEGVIVNLLHVTDIRETEDGLRLYWGDGESTPVDEEFRDSVMHKMNTIDNAIIRIASLNF